VSIVHGTEVSNRSSAVPAGSSAKPREGAALILMALALILTVHRAGDRLGRRRRSAPR
jgi:hypothetical protein